jgi:hypothetical protein
LGKGNFVQTRERYPGAIIPNKCRDVKQRRRTPSKMLRPGRSTPRQAEVKSWRRPMKLNSTQVKQTLNQFEAEVLPDSHPAVPELNDLFGDHTFFLDGGGLNVLEPGETADTEVQTGEIVSLASWSDATLTSLRPHEPEPTGVVIVLESRH